MPKIKLKGAHFKLAYTIGENPSLSRELTIQAIKAYWNDPLICKERRLDGIRENDKNLIDYWVHNAIYEPGDDLKILWKRLEKTAFINRSKYQFVKTIVSKVLTNTEIETPQECKELAAKLLLNEPPPKKGRKETLAKYHRDKQLYYISKIVNQHDKYSISAGYPDAPNNLFKLVADATDCTFDTVRDAYRKLNREYTQNIEKTWRGLKTIEEGEK